MKPILHLSRAFLDLLFPRTCEWCGDAFGEGLSNILCRRCFDSIIPYGDPVCSACGVSLPAGAFEGVAGPKCRDCGDRPGPVDRVRAFGTYEGPLRIAHHAFKFEGMEGLAGTIVPRMLAAIPPDFLGGVAGLVPVPMSPERERERGYNAAGLMAAECSRLSGIPVLSLLRKIRSTPPQMSLARGDRIRNPRGAYESASGFPVPDKLVLVDDVLTTGATLEECASVLKRAGAQWVGAVVFGRTPRHG